MLGIWRGGGWQFLNNADLVPALTNRSVTTQLTPCVKSGMGKLVFINMNVDWGIRVLEMVTWHI